jgi:amidohydrolase
MTILAGLAQQIARSKPSKGKVILLFQPAEETGEGAYKVLRDKKFKGINPDYVFALHNLPGYPLNTIIVRKKNYTASSKGMIIKFYGKTSHAAEPEKGINPSNTVSEIIKRFNSLVSDIDQTKDFSLVTVIHVRIGEKAFGTSAGYAEVMVTFRSYLVDDMNLLTCNAELLVMEISKKNKLKYNISYTEEFPTTINDETCVYIIKQAAVQNNLKIKSIRKPFKWTEDFGHFTSIYKGALFGIGSGINYPKLHNPDYDFPEEIINNGINIFYSIIKIINNKG